MTDYPQRLHHAIPKWVQPGCCFHVRIRCDIANPVSLTEPNLGTRLLESVRFYHQRQRWWVHLFLLMPDHCHALLVFPVTESMSRVVGDWKQFHTRHNGIVWQENYFDHRLRKAESLEEKATYIENNPVVKGLCERSEDWPWVIRNYDK